MQLATIDSPALIIGLSLPASAADYVVDSIDLQDAQMRHRISADSEKRSLTSVFCQAFAGFLHHTIARLDAKTMILADSETAFTLGDLRLGNVQVVSTMRGHNIRHVIVRFLSVAGAVQPLFQPAPTPTEAERDAIAISALQDVVGRTYDFACFFEQIAHVTGADMQLNEQTKGIMSKREDLMFRLGLLRRAMSKAETRVQSEQTTQKLRIVG